MGSILLPDQQFSPMENRYLATAPKLTLENVDSGKFMEDAEDYVNDHVIGRDFWVALKAGASVSAASRRTTASTSARRTPSSTGWRPPASPLWRPTRAM